MLWNSDRNIDVVAAQSAIGDFRLVITIIRMTGLWLRWTGGFVVRRGRPLKESQRPDLPMILPGDWENVPLMVQGALIMRVN